MQHPHSKTLRVLADVLDGVPGLPPTSVGVYSNGDAFVQIEKRTDLAELPRHDQARDESLRSVAVDMVAALLGLKTRSTNASYGYVGHWGGNPEQPEVEVYAPGVDVRTKASVETLTDGAA